MIPLTIITELFVNGSWVDVSADVRASDDVVITRGRRDEGSTTDPARMTLKINNRHGRYSPRNPRSEYYKLIGRNTPIRLAVRLPDGRLSYRFTGEVAKWPQRWDLSGNDAWVPLEASGLMRRLRQGQPPLTDTMRRYMATLAPLAYWPLTDGLDASEGGEISGGGGSLSYRRINSSRIDQPPKWAGGQLASWLDPTLTVGNGSATNMRASVNYVPASYDGWSLDFCFSGPGQRLEFVVSGTDTGNEGFAVDISVNLSDTLYVEVGRTLTPNGGLASRVVLSPVGGIPLPTSVLDGPNHMRLSVNEVTGGNDWEVVLNGESLYVGNDTIDVLGAQRLDMEINTNHPDLDGGLTVGHVAYWGQNAAPNAADMYQALTGFRGERAGERLVRLCSEENVPLLLTGDPAETPPMGPQPIGRFLDLLRDAEMVDGGALTEARNDMSLMYRTRTHRYADGTTALTLDYSAGQVSDPFHPVEDDQRLVNEVTASRREGGEGRYVETTGPLSVQPPPVGVGQYAQSVTLNVDKDSQLVDQAAWRVHLGTVDEARYPRITVNLLARPELITDVSNLYVGDHFRIDNPPEWLPPDPIGQVVEGYSERINLNRWISEIVAAPASPWTVATTTYATLTEDFEDTTYAFPLLTTVNTPWQRDSTYAYRGSWSYRSGDIGPDGLSEFVIDVPAGANQLTFAYKLSTEALWDKLIVFDSQRVRLMDSGEKDWQVATLDVTGELEIRFQYTKDSNTDSGEDGVWVDELTWVMAGDAADAGTAQPNRADTDGSALAADIDATQASVTVITAGLPWTTDPAEFPLDIRTGGEVMRASAIFGTDTFDRTVADGWGTPTGGPSWVLRAGSPSYFDVAGGTGNFTDVSAFSERGINLDIEAVGFDVSAGFSLSALPANTAYISVLVGRTDKINTTYGTNTDLVGTLEIDSSGTCIVYLAEVWVDGTWTPRALSILENVGTHSAGVIHRLRVDAADGSPRLKWWLDGTPEPSDWLIDFNGSPLETLVPGPAGVDMRGLGVGPTVSFTDFQLRDKQVLDVQRSVNGIAKTHAAGTSVQLARPASVAL